MEAWLILGIVIFASLLLLLAIGVPVAFSLSFVALVFMYCFWGLDGLITIATTAFSANSNFLMIAIPLFILMGEAVSISGIGSDSFKMLDLWLGWLPGGAAVTTVASSTVFGAVTGFAPATCSALGPVLIPEMIKRNYKKGFSVGALAGGAGLAIIIPPSILMIIYGFLAEVSIGKLFYGGLIPGILLSALFIGYIIIRAIIDPKAAPLTIKSTSMKQKIQSSIFILPFATLVLLVLGSIWGGVASPSEAAALGAFGALILTICYKKFTWFALKNILKASVKVNTMVMFIVMGGVLFTQALIHSGFAAELALWATSLAISPWIILIIMQVIILFLGCLMDPASILFITVPIFLPIVKALEFDLIWFGILLMLNCGIAAMTPPVGIILYVIKSISGPEISLKDIIRGATPYWFIYVCGMFIIGFFPGLVTWLPSMIIK